MNPGDVAPDFEAHDQHGNGVRLSDLVSDGPVVLFFYPKAGSMGCTAEACHFRDLEAEFRKAGVRAVGISMDPVETQAEFDRRNNLGLTLLSDAGGAIARSFGLDRRGPLRPRRATFLIDPDRTVRHVIASEFDMSKHADEALATLAMDR